MQHVDLSAQYGGQQGHSDVHAVLCLTEIRRPRVCVHLGTERKTKETKENVKYGTRFSFVANTILGMK